MDSKIAAMVTRMPYTRVNTQVLLVRASRLSQMLSVDTLTSSTPCTLLESPARTGTVISINRFSDSWFVVSPLKQRITSSDTTYLFSIRP